MTSRTRPSSTDYDDLVHATSNAALVFLATKLVAAVAYAVAVGGAIRLATMASVVPILELGMSRQSFIDLTTTSVVAGATVMVAALLTASLKTPAAGRRRRPQVLTGWFLGVVMALVDLSIGLVAHARGPEALRVGWALQAGAVLVAVVIVFVGFEAWREESGAGHDDQRPTPCTGLGASS